MSLLKQWLLGSRVKECGRRGYIRWVNGAKYRPKRSRGLLEIIINVPRGVARNYGPFALEMTLNCPQCSSLK